MIQLDFRSRIKKNPTPPKNLRLLATPCDKVLVSKFYPILSEVAVLITPTCSQHAAAHKFHKLMYFHTKQI